MVKLQSSQLTLQQATSKNSTQQNQFEKIPTEITLKILGYLDPTQRLNFGQCCRQNYSRMGAIPSGVLGVSWHAVQQKAPEMLFLSDGQQNKTRFYGGGYVIWGGRDYCSPVNNGSIEIFNEHGRHQSSVYPDFQRNELRRVDGIIPFKTGGIIAKIGHGCGYHYDLVTRDGQYKRIGTTRNGYHYYGMSFHNSTSITFISEEEVGDGSDTQAGVSIYHESMKEARFIPVTGISYKYVHIQAIQPIKNDGFVILTNNNTFKRPYEIVETSLQTFDKAGKCALKQKIETNPAGIAIMPNGNVAVIPRKSKSSDIRYSVYHPLEGKKNDVLFKMKPDQHYKSMPLIRKTRILKDTSMLVSLDYPRPTGSSFTRKELVKIATYSHQDKGVDIFQIHKLPDDLKINNLFF